MTSVRFKFAVLKVLAKWPERRISLDEIRREIGARIVNVGPADQPNRISVLADIDIFQSGLLSQSEHGLQITEAGLSFLQALENSDEPFQTTSPVPMFQPFATRIDNLPSEEGRPIILGAGLGDAGNTPHQARQEGQPVTTSDPEIISQATDIEPVDEMVSPPHEPAGDDLDRPFSKKGNNAPRNEQLDTIPLEAPTFLRRDTGSRIEALSTPSRLFAFVTQKGRSLINAWRHHLVEDTDPPITARSNGRIGGAAFALLSLMTVFACLGAVIAFVQIRSLKSDVATLRRELLPLKAGLGKLELVEQARKGARENPASQNAGLKQAGSDNEPSNAHVTLNLSSEEIQLIRDYIKPAPSAKSSAPDIKVGDLIGSATIPLPPSLAEKVPQLAGARFTTRNGAIAISANGSHRADVVLPRN